MAIIIANIPPKLSITLGFKEALTVRDKLQTHLNEISKDNDDVFLSYSNIAEEIDSTPEIVRDLLFAYSGDWRDNGGITIRGNQSE